MKILKNILLSGAVLLAAVNSYATISNVSDGAIDLSLDFELIDNALSPNPSDTYLYVAHKGTSVTFDFVDGFGFYLPWWAGGGFVGSHNSEILTTDPNSGTYDFNVDTGSLNFSGSYLHTGSLVSWNVESTVTDHFGDDMWSGTFTSHVPDSGSTVALLGLGILGLVGLRRRIA